MRIVTREVAGVVILSPDQSSVLLGYAGVFVNQLVIPGGKIERGESSIDAAKREVLEETGIDLSKVDINQIGDPKLLRTAYSEKIDRITNEKYIANLIFHDYLAVLTEMKYPVDGDDFTGSAWFGREEASQKSAEPTRDLLRAVGFFNE